jgi:hypothetical protein
VDGRRHRCGGAAGEHELEHRHLRGRVLHGDPVGLKLDVGGAARELLALGVGEVAEDHLLSERQRPAEALAHDLEAAPDGVVDLLDELGGGFDGWHGRLPSRRRTAVAAARSPGTRSRAVF